MLDWKFRSNREKAEGVWLTHGFVIPIGWLASIIGVFTVSDGINFLDNVPFLLYYLYVIPIILFHLSARIIQPATYTLKAYAIFQILLLTGFGLLAFFSEESFLAWLKEIYIGMLLFQAFLFIQYMTINLIGVTAYKFFQGYYRPKMNSN